MKEQVVAQRGGMHAGKEAEQVESQRGSTEEQQEDRPRQLKSRSGPEFLGLTRCAACYNQKASSMPHWGDGSESSSSAEDSGPEVDWESESSSSSSSSFCSEKASSDTPEEASPEEVSPEEAPPEEAPPEEASPEEVSPEPRAAAGAEEASVSLEDKIRKKGATRRAPLVKSYSLPASLTPRLTPLSLLPRPRTVVSTLHLQVVTQTDAEDGAHVAKQQQLFRRSEERKPWGSDGGINTMKHQQHQFFPPQGHMLRPPPPLHTHFAPYPPALHHAPLHAPLHPHTAPHTHLQAAAPQPCWCCYPAHSAHT